MKINQLEIFEIFILPAKLQFMTDEAKNKMQRRDEG